MANCTKIAFLVLLLLFISIFTSCKQENDQEFTVSGKLENVKESYFIAAYEQRDSLIIDTIRVDKKGNFLIKNTIDSLSIMSLYFNDNNKYTYVFIDKGLHVDISGDVLYPDLLDTRGGSINDDLRVFKTKHTDLLKKRTDILTALEDSCYSSNELDIHYEKTLLTNLNNVNFELATVVGEYVKMNPDKISSVMLINAFVKSELTIPRLDECLAKLRGDAARFYIAQELSKYSELIKQSAEGVMCPSFSRKTNDGKIFNIISQRGKYILLSFMPSDCETFKEQNDYQIDLYKKFKHDNVNIEFTTILVNSENKVMPSNISKSIKWTLIYEEKGWSSELLETFNIRNIPFHILIDPNGIILNRDISLFSLEEIMDNVPNKIKPELIKK